MDPYSSNQLCSRVNYNIYMSVLLKLICKFNSVLLVSNCIFTLFLNSYFKITLNSKEMAKIVQRIYLYVLPIFPQQYHLKKLHCQDQEFDIFKTINKARNIIQILPGLLAVFFLCSYMKFHYMYRFLYSQITKLFNIHK